MLINYKSQHGAIGKKLLVALAVFVVLLVVVYFVATSTAFFKGVILPRASKSIGADVTVADASIHPFSSVGLQKIKIQAPGKEPLLEADDIRARYSLTAIMGGNIKVDELTIVSPVIRIVEDAEGHKNTDALTKKEEKPAPKKDEKTPRVDIKNVTLKDATIQLIKKYKDGHQDVTEISGLNLSLDQLKNGGSGKLDLSAGVKMNAAVTNTLAAALNGKFDFALTQDLLPASAKGALKADVKTTSGTYADLKNVSVDLNCDLSPTEIKQISLQFLQTGKALGEVQASGPFDANKVEGKINVEASIDRQVLNLFGASKGLDFGSTKINSTNEIQISNQGKLIAVTGALRGDSFGVTVTNLSTPKLDLVAAYNLTVDQQNQNALIKTFTLSGTQNKQAFLRGELSKPMKLDWGKAGTVDESAFELNLTNLNLADWKAFAPELDPAGQVGLKLTLLSHQAGKKLKFDMASSMAKLSLLLSTNKTAPVDLTFSVSGEVNDFEKVALQKCELRFAQKNQPGGNVSLTGNLDTKAQTGRFDFKLNQLNQNALGPFLASSLGDKKLVSMALTGGGSATLKSADSQELKADLALTNLVVRDLKKEKAEPPLSVKLAVDAGIAKQVFDLRNLQIGLSPTTRAKNQLTIKGKLDLSKTNAINGELAVNSDALDLTDFYAIYGSSDTNAPAKPATENKNEEPEATKLPVGQITADVKINALFLREIAITNLQVLTKINGSKVVVNPAQLTLNGAPVKATADLDLGVKGYVYDLSFSAERIPLEPVANSFIPENKGQYKGEIIALAKIKGAGTTGVNLKKTLDGNLGFSFTNANIQIVGPKMKKVLVPIATVLRVPEITSSPVSWVDSKIVFGAGNIDLKNFTMTSAAFVADTAAVIPMADVLTNSPLNHIPVNFQLSRNLAERSKLLPANTPAEAKYVALPNLVKLGGTVGDPTPEINKASLVGILGRSVGGFVPGEAGQVIQGLGGVLTGQQSASSTNKTASTNKLSGATNLVPQVLDLFKKKKK